MSSILLFQSFSIYYTTCDIFYKISLYQQVWPRTDQSQSCNETLMMSSFWLNCAVACKCSCYVSHYSSYKNIARVCGCAWHPFYQHFCLSAFLIFKSTFRDILTKFGTIIHFGSSMKRIESGLAGTSFITTLPIKLYFQKISTYYIKKMLPFFKIYMNVKWTLAI